MERTMAQRVKQPNNNSVANTFPPEADGDFDIVNPVDIAAWREKLNKRFGLGEGRLESLDVLPAK